MTVREEAVDIPCDDGAVLSGSLFQPAGPPQAIFILHGATGVPQDYYARFARWLAQAQGAAVLTYDYRDSGRSARGPVRQSRVTMGDWAVRDQGAALDFACQRFPDLPVEVVGHSLGGMALPFHAGAGRVRRLTAVASGPVHWTDHPAGFMPQVLGFWFLAGPAVTAMMGYMPGRLLGMGADLPAGVYWQWRRWCISRPFYRVDYDRSLPRPDPGRFTGTLRLVAIADDPMIPPHAAYRLATLYPAAAVEQVLLTPADAGVASIGHLRVFSERCRAAWPRLMGLAAPDAPAIP